MRLPYAATNKQLSALEVTSLEGLVQAYFGQGIATSSMRSYSLAKRWYSELCCTYHSPPLPLSEHLAQQGLKSQSISAYLSATCKCLLACQRLRGQTGLDSSMC